MHRLIIKIKSFELKSKEIGELLELETLREKEKEKEGERERERERERESKNALRYICISKCLHECTMK